MSIVVSQRQLRKGIVASTLLALFWMSAALAWAVVVPSSNKHEQRNFDARVQLNARFSVGASAEQLQAEERLRARIPELAATYESASGALRSLNNRTGYLTEPFGGADPLDTGLGFVRGNLDLLGLTPRDLVNFEVTDSVFTAATGATHLYLRQTHRGLPLYNGQLQLHVNRDGRLISLNSAFLPRLAEAVNVAEIVPAIGADLAVANAAAELGIDLSGLPAVLSNPRGIDQRTPISSLGISLEPIEARLMWLPIRQGDARLVWNFQIYTLDTAHWYDITVDAMTGEVWTRFDWVSSGTYRVYEQPIESPEHTTPLPPSDARSLQVDPEEALASPSGWFGGGIMDGNNVHACADANANNGCDTPQPSCSGATCDFSIDLSSAPSNSIPAAITNLFYWNNIIHDVQYQYGFDEAGGNFQEDNFGRGGSGSDSVNADAQDGSGNCNANFGTPTDGSNPRMQMFTCTNASPARDGDYDNGVIVHEYGHGISTRQVGGPSNSSCLNNNQQAGEGWSDWFALAYTAEVGDQGADARGIGAYLFNTDLDVGIRDLPYSTDSAVNNWTYESIQGAVIPHGVGSRWAEAAWRVYWALVDQYGFDSDLYNATGGSGNQRALLYLNEGLKNTACSPTFIDNRDGVIQAAVDNFGGADVCVIWETFAAWGLGTDASTPGSNSTSATNGFSIPSECQCQPNPLADAGPDQTICQGEFATVGTAAQSGHTYSWTPGGETTAQITVAPALDTTYSVTAQTACGSAGDSATVFVDDGSVPAGLDDDLEGDVSGWAATGLWHLTSDSACASPGYSSPFNAFYYGQDSSCTYDTGGITTGTLTSPVVGGITSSSTLTFDYFRVVEDFNGNFDKTEVEIVSSSGTTTVFALDSSTSSTAAWVSSGAISLSAFAGESIQVRFRFDSVDDVGNNFVGWLIDDVVVTGESNCGPINTPPTVSIASPSDGSSFDSGVSVSFSGSATDTEDGDISSGLSWTSSLDGSIGSGGSFSTSTLSIGTHTITASATDSGGLTDSDSISVTINAVGGGCTDCVDWSSTTTVSYSNQDVSGNVTVEDGGDTLLLLDNTWRRTTQTFQITTNTVVEFEFSSAVQGEIHGLGFDEDDTLTNNVRIFQVHGTQNWTSANHDFDNYSGAGAFTTYQIPVGQFYTGTMFLVVVNDNDAGSGNDSRFRNVRVFEDIPTGGCAADVDFSAGAEGWTNSATSTCATGSFVVGSPTEVVSSGVTTQLAGDHTTGTGNAFFSATNTSAGVNDVDSGNCVVTSPVYSVTEASDVSAWYFHGQRDAGDDGSGDFFLFEISTNGGSTWSSLASNGDSVSNAAWTNVTTTVGAGSSVQFRIQVSDGTSAGDLVEAGVDDISICAQ